MRLLQVAGLDAGGGGSGRQLSDAEAAAIHSNFTLYIVEVREFLDMHSLRMAPPLGARIPDHHEIFQEAFLPVEGTAILSMYLHTASGDDECRFPRCLSGSIVLRSKP